jgi:hypothetical protein
VTLPLDLVLPGATSAVAPGGVPKVLGIDPSTSCTGLAGDGWTDTIKTKARRKHQSTRDFMHARTRHIIATLDDYLSGVDLAVLEGPATGPGMDMDRQLAHLNWEIRDLLWSRGVPYAVVNPGNLKVYVLGTRSRNAKQIAEDNAAGRKAKDRIVEVVSGWFPWLDGGDDEADAAALWAMGRDWLGLPAAQVGSVQRGALQNVAWPDMERTFAVDEVAA